MQTRLVYGAILIALAICTNMNSKKLLVESNHTQTVVLFEPSSISIGPGNNLTLNVLVENVTSLYGLDIQITWDTAFMEYLTHTATIPVEAYPEGVLHEPLFGWIKNDVDENASMPGSAAGTRYWVAVASQHPAPAFNGTGTAFTITFVAKNQTGTTDLDFTHIELSDDMANPISHTSSNCTVEICGPSDVAVVNVTSSKTVVGKGYSSTFNVTLENQGTKTETSNLTLFANNTVIQTKEATLESNSSEILTFYWNTSEFSKGNYTISAHIDPVLGEINVVDNNLTDGWIIVAMIGDITGPDGWPDGKCDIRDISLVAIYFGQNVPPAPANCDLTGLGGVPDRKVDIRDISLVAIHYGEIDP